MKKLLIGTSLVCLLALSVFYSCSDKFLDTVPTGVSNPTLLANDAGKSEYAPLPQTQIDLEGTDVLTQNPRY